MGQILRPESIGAISKVSNTALSVASSFINIGGRQYSTSTLSVSTSVSGAGGLDTGTIAASQFYYIYAVKNASGVYGVLSLSSSAPTGFAAYKLIGQCTTDSSSYLVAADKTKSDDSPIGHVISAILTESQFRAIHGAGWILADGRSVSGSKYATITTSSTVPDLRGMVLRGKNNGRADGSQNPAADRALGDFESDQIQGHAHNYYHDGNPGGSLGHSYGMNGASGSGNSSGGTAWTDAASRTDGTNGTPRTGLETRMKNITVNHFIKIN